LKTPLKVQQTVVAMTSGGARPVRLAELVATLSLATDLGLGQPMEHVLRQTRIALRLADAAGLTPAERVATYHVALLAWVGCAADTSDLARLFGDETELYGASYDVDLAGLAAARFFATHLGAGRSALVQVGMLGHFVAAAGRPVREVMDAHCLGSGALAERLGLGEDVREALVAVFERWDGKGAPRGLHGMQMPAPTRVVQLADTIETLHRLPGTGAALAATADRSGTRFDPAVVAAFHADPEAILAGLDDATSRSGDRDRTCRYRLVVRTAPFGRASQAGGRRRAPSTKAWNWSSVSAPIVWSAVERWTCS
jgi:hypothetical protein